MSWDDAEPTDRLPGERADHEPTRALDDDGRPDDGATDRPADRTTDRLPGRPTAGPVVPPGAGPAVSPSGAGSHAVGRHELGSAGAAPLPPPGGTAPYRQAGASAGGLGSGRLGQQAPSQPVAQPLGQQPLGQQPLYQGPSQPGPYQSAASQPFPHAYQNPYQGGGVQPWTPQSGYVPPPPPDWHQQQARAYQPAPPQRGGRVIGLAAVVALVVGLIAGGGAAVTVVALGGDDPVSEPAGPAIGVGSAAPRVRSGSVSAVAASLLPSVVQLKVEGADDSAATGSGFVIDDAGHILTNNHVVAAAASGGSIQVVTQSGKTATARLVGRSPAYDLAVVQVTGLTAPSVQFGRSDLAVVGQDVVAIGSPLGLAGTVTSGIVSAKNRPVTAGGEGEISYINALQTDAAINPGNSGGPLVDMNARVIGINSAIATVRGSDPGGSGNIGLGFAIPIDQARRTAQQLIASGKASYPVIGANVDMRFEGGARVSEVTAGSPAQRAGLRTGDVVTSIDGQSVTTAEALIVAIRTHRPGEHVKLSFERGGKSRQVTVTLGRQTG